ncbi:MAG: rod shape-determining protein RodA [Deltaproteobacteria bacterium RIFOXYD12_FULL_57_12]|nr:MAG: rod shape-determining protein RodA [Deltaproteobacteria bacterium RIFOXYD12_FULL_57_12]
MLRFDRRLLYNFDWIMLGAVLAVTTMGLINLYSSSNTGAGASPIFYKQLTFFFAGLGLVLLAISIDYRRLLIWNYPCYWLIILLLLAALLLGKTVGGSQRWLNLGFFRLQPSEPAKLMLIITLASYYYRKDTGKGFTIGELIVPALLTVLPFALIVKQPDLGTALILAAVFISMTLFVKLRRNTVAILLSFCLAAIPLGWKFFLKPYQRQRIETFLNPEGDPMNSGYHIMQSKIAVGSGLKFGKGYLDGTQGHLHFLPERHTDFAFSVWAEEWGFAGCLFFLACYFLLILWGLNIGLTSRDKFGVLLVFGIVSLIFWQAIINLCMVMGLLPVVGIPLPLFSYGGSSLLTTMLAVGILINIRMRRYQGKN